MAALAFNSALGDKNWNTAADMDESGIVNAFDLIILAQNFGRKLYP
jgi:hypothetical protein